MNFHNIFITNSFSNRPSEDAKIEEEISKTDEECGKSNTNFSEGNLEILRKEVDLLPKCAEKEILDFIISLSEKKMSIISLFSQSSVQSSTHHINSHINEIIELLKTENLWTENFMKDFDVIKLNCKLFNNKASIKYLRVLLNEIKFKCIQNYVDNSIETTTSGADLTKICEDTIKIKKYNELFTEQLDISKVY